MKKLFLCVFMLFGLFCFSFAYDLTDQDLLLVDKLSEKVENIIKQKGEEKREVYVSILYRFSSRYKVSNQRFSEIFLKIGNNLKNKNLVDQEKTMDQFNVCETFEVCNGSVVNKTNQQVCNGICELPKEFDWRNRNGINWNTPVKDQGQTPTCQQFGAIASIETSINLFFNQKLNVDLSEQMLLSCANTVYEDTESIEKIEDGNVFRVPTSFGYELNGRILDPNIDGRNCKGCDKAIQAASKNKLAGLCANLQSPASILCRVKEVGVPDELCMEQKKQMDGTFYTCGEYCNDFNKRIRKISGFGNLLTNSTITEFGYGLYYHYQEKVNEGLLKQKIITNGPIVAVGFSNEYSKGFIEGHGVSIVGRYTKEGKTIWIFKNSRGESFGNMGYGTGFFTKKLEDTNMTFSYVKYPIIQPDIESNKIICDNKDGDNFCNRGIGKDKPSYCPLNCRSSLIDWDDLNGKIGNLGIQNRF